MQLMHYLCIMRTTVSIDDDLLETARQRATSRGKTLNQLLEDALRRELAATEQAAARPPVPVFRAGTGPRPGIDLTSNRALHEVLDEGLPVSERR